MVWAKCLSTAARSWASTGAGNVCCAMGRRCRRATSDLFEQGMGGVSVSQGMSFDVQLFESYFSRSFSKADVFEIVDWFQPCYSRFLSLCFLQQKACF